MVKPVDEPAAGEALHNTTSSPGQSALHTHSDQVNPRISRRNLLKATMMAAAGFKAGQVLSQTGTSTPNKHLSLESPMFQSAVRQAQLVREKQISSEELVKLHLHRIEQLNPDINAIIALADNAITQARQADSALAKGDLLGPLHGLPMTIKDCFDSSGIISTWGTLGRKEFVPDADATVIKRLKAAGAILIGKTNTPEFTLSFETYNRLHGFTNNPYDLRRSPGGSSGGAAAAIAAGLTPFDIGTDYGGSIRVPSHCCGIVGIKPTSGSVPRTGLCLPPGMLTDSLSHVGPMARRVEDLKMLLPIIWGPDTIDSRIHAVPYKAPDTVHLKGLKCAVMTDNGLSTPDKETIAAVRMAANFLSDAGLDIKEDRLAGVADTLLVDGAFWALGAYSGIKQLLDSAGTQPEQYANNWFKELGESIPDEVSTKALTEQLSRFETFRRVLQQHMSQYDVLISPVNAHPASLHPTPGDMPFPVEDASYTIVFDLTGWPSGVVRGGTSPDGLPIGVQVTANPWREDIVLAVMSHLESVHPEFTVSENNPFLSEA